MKKKISVVLFSVMIIAACGTDISTDIAPEIIKKTFQLSDMDKVEILGIAEDSKDVRIVKFTVNKVPSSVKMRKYDKGWQLDEIQNELGLWSPVAPYKEEPKDVALTEAWATLKNVYERRTDIIENMLEEVEKSIGTSETFITVRVALNKAKNVQSEEKILYDPDAFNNFAQAQEALGTAAIALLNEIEKYPELKSSQAYRDLRVQLEGTENRIAVERRRYNEAAQKFNNVPHGVYIPGKIVRKMPYIKAML